MISFVIKTTRLFVGCYVTGNKFYATNMAGRRIYNSLKVICRVGYCRIKSYDTRM